MRIGLGADWHLLNHFETVPLQADNLLGVVCEKPELPYAKVEKDLCAEPVIAQIAGIAEFGIRLDGVKALLLQLVGMNFCRQPDAASFLTHVNQDAIAFLLDLSKRGMQLISAIASA